MADNKEPQTDNRIEDLTVSETESANVKGGPSDYLLQIDGIKGETDDRRSS